MKSFTAVVAGVMVSHTLVARAQPPAPPSTPKVQAPHAPQSPAEKLKASESLYASAKTYQDTGEVKIEFKTPNPHTDVRPFATVFERAGRFLWQFHSTDRNTRKADDLFVVWSPDQESFHSWWTLTKELKAHDTLDSALAGPTGISGGSATAIIPLLRTDMRWGAGALRIDNPTEKPAEAIDGVQCSVITGSAPHGGGEVTLWLDPSLAIRRILRVNEIDPAKISGGKGAPFTTITTISIKPIFDAEIPADKFAPPNVPKANDAAQSPEPAKPSVK